MRSYPDELHCLAFVNECFARDMAAIGEGDLERPTPCSDWTVRELLDHVTGGNRYTLHIVGGASSDAAIESVMGSFGPEHQPVGALEASLGWQLEALEAVVSPEMQCQHVAGPMSVHDVVRTRLHDMIVHGWDLGRSLDPRWQLDDVVARWLIDDLADPSAPARRHLLAGSKAPLADADSILAAYGRDLSWVP